MGLEHIAAAIEPHAESVDVVDLRRESGRTRDFMRDDTDAVCFSVNWDSDQEFVREEIRSAGSDVTVIVGGRHATVDPELWLSELSNISMVVRGDGEEVVEDYCRGVSLDEISGLSFRKDGRIIHNPSRELGPVHDNIYPDRRRRRYSYEISFQGINTGLTIDTMSSSRGCPFNCNFCSFSRNPWGGKRSWSARSPESVVDELGQIEADIIAFTDDLFTLDMGRVERICELIKARGIRKKMLVNARAEVARRPDVLRKMEKAGFFLLMLGIESACDKTLKSMGKGFDTARLREYFKVLRKSSMFLHGYFILGNIGESVEEMLLMPSFARELGVDTIALSTLRVTPHSGLEELVANSPGYHVAANGKVYSDHCSAKQIRQLRRQMVKMFYSTGQMLRLGHKAIRNGALHLLPRIFLRLPKMAFILASHSLKHRRKLKLGLSKQG